MVLDDFEKKEGAPEEEEMSRNAMQTVALDAIYALLTRIATNEVIDPVALLSNLCDKPYEEVDPFLKAVVIYAIKEYPHIVEAFNGKMKRWTFDRLNRVEQAILILAYVHFFHAEPGIDKGVVINIAVKQAKVYCAETDYKFVNAILDNLLIPFQSGEGGEEDDDF